MKSPNMLICVTFTRRWMWLWTIANRFGLSRVQKWLEDHPSFAPTQMRYATRSRILKSGQLDWALYSTPVDAPVEDGWPDVRGV